MISTINERVAMGNNNINKIFEDIFDNQLKTGKMLRKAKRQIKVEDDSHQFDLYVYVKNGPEGECVCDVMDMVPEQFVNRKETICRSCNGVVGFDQRVDYDAYWGYSGFDEYHDEGEYEQED